MLDLPPDQLRVIQRLISSPAVQAAAALDMPLERAELFVSRVAEYVRENGARLGDRVHMLILGSLSREGEPLCTSSALEHLNSGRRLLYVDEELRLIRAIDSEARISDCTKGTEEAQTLGVLIQGTYTYYFLKGRCIDEGDVLNPRAGAPIPSKWHRPMAEFDQLLQDHKCNCVDREQHFKYWHDRRARILRSGPDGTETLFHQSLFWWLKNFVADKLKVYAEPAAFGQDKTDIIVVTVRGSQIVEVKWLGRNEKSTGYGQERIDEGLGQVALYLDGDDDLVCGYLVIYDGRKWEQHQNESGHNSALQHPRCQAPRIVFLQSETPSEAAPKIAAGSRR